MNFNEFYFQEKITSDIRRAFTKNVLKKRVEGVNVDNLPYLGKFDNKMFEEFENYLRREYQKYKKTSNGKDSKSKVKKPPSKKVYVTDLYAGEIDDDAKKIDEDIQEISSISIYYASNKPNKKGKAKYILIRFYDSDNQLVNYIGMNKQANDYFKDIFGMTFDAFKTRADSRLNGKTSTRKDDTDKLISRMGLSQDTNNIDSQTSSKHMDQIGLLDITDDEFNMIHDLWGSGKKTRQKKGQTRFVGKFDRYPFVNNLGSGYKYSNGSYSVYLIDTETDYALLAFDGKDSYRWAKRNGMLDIWRLSPGNEIRWIKGDIDSLPEGKNYD